MNIHRKQITFAGDREGAVRADRPGRRHLRAALASRLEEALGGQLSLSVELARRARHILMILRGRLSFRDRHAKIIPLWQASCYRAPSR
jgi:hypothetical protein